LAMRQEATEKASSLAATSAHIKGRSRRPAEFPAGPAELTQGQRRYHELLGMLSGSVIFHGA